MRKLENLTAEMTYVGDLQLGCMKGSLDYLGIEVSRPWLAGVTGQAFVIGIAPDVCLSSVSACLEDEYADGTMARLGRNLGYDLEYHRFDGRDPNKRAIAWQRFQAALDAGRPCYGYFNFCYQLYVGYDADGFYIGDGATNAGQGPFSMLDVDGDSWSLCIVGPAGSSSDDRTAVKDGLEFVIRHARGGEVGDGPGETQAGDAHGPEAYRRWIAFMDAGKESGTWRAIDHYVRCRELAVEFLSEAESRLSADLGPLLRDARMLYQCVCDDLWPVADAFGQGKRPAPFGEPGSFHAEAADRLRSACDTETKALTVLERIAAAL